jgi:hypothetical protein
LSEIKIRPCLKEDVVQQFAQLVAGWETLYLLTGTAAATLMGLLFVAISIHTDWFEGRGRLDLRNFGALTFNSFFYVLLISVLFLVPGFGWREMGGVLLVVGLADLTNSTLQRRRASQVKGEAGAGDIASSFNFPILCLIGLVLSAFGILLRIPDSLYAILVIVICLLGSAAVNAWTLLVQADSTS